MKIIEYGDDVGQDAGPGNEDLVFEAFANLHLEIMPNHHRSTCGLINTIAGMFQWKNENCDIFDEK
jgi:hypothetical protein